MKYRKLPVIIEAIQYVDRTSLEEMRTAWGEAFDAHHTRNLEGHLLILTTSGWVCAKKFEYIIKGVIDEFYPCPQDVFKTTYEEAT